MTMTSNEKKRIAARRKVRKAVTATKRKRTVAATKRKRAGAPPAKKPRTTLGKQASKLKRQQPRQRTTRRAV
jgi:hypothetical protein